MRQDVDIGLAKFLSQEMTENSKRSELTALLEEVDELEAEVRGRPNVLGGVIYINHALCAQASKILCAVLAVGIYTGPSRYIWAWLGSPLLKCSHFHVTAVIMEQDGRTVPCENREREMREPRFSPEVIRMHPEMRRALFHSRGRGVGTVLRCRMDR